MNIIRIATVFSFYVGICAQAKSAKWIPAAVQNFAVSGTASAGSKAATVVNSTVQMQGDEILHATIQFNTEKPTVFILKSAVKNAGANQTGLSYTLSGDLTYEGKTQSVQFPAVIQNSDRAISANVQAVLPNKVPVTIQLQANKASVTHPWTNSQGSE